jgi:hypothetical protein
MQVVHERCCGLDVHKKTVVACVLTAVGREVRTFGTVTRELLRLADWLHEEKVSHVAMESTASTGSGSITCSRTRGWWCWWSMRSKSRRCRAERPMSRTPSGSPTCSATAC